MIQRLQLITDGEVTATCAFWRGGPIAVRGEENEGLRVYGEFEHVEESEEFDEVHMVDEGDCGFFNEDHTLDDFSDPQEA